MQCNKATSFVIDGKDFAQILKQNLKKNPNPLMQYSLTSRLYMCYILDD